jgi:site-specific DNA recombinase
MKTTMETDGKTKIKQKRVAIYLRVSTDEQAKGDHYGLKVQEDRLRQFCASQGYLLSEEHVYRDEGFSGSLEEKDRPGLRSAFESAREKEFELLIVYRLDRLFRNQRKLLNALQRLMDYGVGFQSSTEAFDTETPSGRLMLQILGSFAEHERETIRDRMMAGKIRAAKDGKWVTGVPPYGYRVDEKTQTLVIQEEEADVVRKFYEWLVYEKCSLREITRRAIKQNLPTPKHKTSKGKNRVGGKWYKRTINRILVNEVYTGTFYYNKYKRPFKYLDAVLEEDNQRPKEDHIEISVPPVITQNLFDKSIQQLENNRVFQKRNEKRTYLFAQLLYSGYSGKKLHSGYQTPKKDKVTPYLGKYYHVYVPALERIGTEYDKCNPEGQYAESRLMPIWDTLLSILSEPENVIPQLEEYTFKTSNEAKVRRQISALDKQFETLQTKKQRIVEVYTEANMDKDDYNQRMKQVRKDEKDIVIQKQKLSQTLLKRTEQKDRNIIIKGLYAKLQNRLDKLNYEQQQYILRLFVEKITLYHKKGYAEVVFKFPTNTTVPKSAPASVTEGKHMRLVLHVKILSEKERRQQIIKSVPEMCKSKNKVTA